MSVCVTIGPLPDVRRECHPAGPTRRGRERPGESPLSGPARAAARGKRATLEAGPTVPVPPARPPQARTRVPARPGRRTGGLYANGVAVLAEPPVGTDRYGPRPQPLIGLTPRRPPTNRPGTLDSVPAAVARPRHPVAPARSLRPARPRASPGRGPDPAGRRLPVGPRKEGREMPSGAGFVQGNKFKAPRATGALRSPSPPALRGRGVRGEGGAARRGWKQPSDSASAFPLTPDPSPPAGGRGESEGSLAARTRRAKIDAVAGPPGLPVFPGPRGRTPDPHPPHQRRHTMRRTPARTLLVAAALAVGLALLGSAGAADPATDPEFRAMVDQDAKIIQQAADAVDKAASPKEKKVVGPERRQRDQVQRPAHGHLRQRPDRRDGQGGRRPRRGRPRRGDQDLQGGRGRELQGGGRRPPRAWPTSSRPPTPRRSTWSRSWAS